MMEGVLDDVVVEETGSHRDPAPHPFVMDDEMEVVMEGGGRGGA